VLVIQPTYRVVGFFIITITSPDFVQSPLRRYLAIPIYGFAREQSLVLPRGKTTTGYADFAEGKSRNEEPEAIINYEASQLKACPVRRASEAGLIKETKSALGGRSGSEMWMQKLRMASLDFENRLQEKDVTLRSPTTP
jgi:hypothetical protein